VRKTQSHSVAHPEIYEAIAIVIRNGGPWPTPPETSGDRSKDFEPFYQDGSKPFDPSTLLCGEIRRENSTVEKKKFYG